MNKLYALAICVLIIVFSTSAYAKEGSGRFNIGGSLGYLDPQDSSYEPAIYPSINLGWGIDLDCSIELTIGRAYIKGDVDGEDVEGTDITTYPIQLTVLPRLALKSSSLYIGGGIGYYINQAELNNEGKDFIKLMRVFDPTYDISVELDNAYGAHIAAGGDIFLSKNTALNLDARYFWAWSFATVEITESGETVKFKDKFDIDSAIISIGLKYLF